LEKGRKEEDEEKGEGRASGASEEYRRSISRRFVRWFGDRGRRRRRWRGKALTRESSSSFSPLRSRARSREVLGVLSSESPSRSRERAKTKRGSIISPRLYPTSAWRINFVARRAVNAALSLSLSLSLELIDPKRIRLRLFSRFSRRREAALDGSYVLVFPRENVFKTHHRGAWTR